MFLVFLFAPYTRPFNILNCFLAGRAVAPPALLLLVLLKSSFAIVLSRDFDLRISAFALCVLHNAPSPELFESEPSREERRLFFFGHLGLMCVFSDVLLDSGTPKSASSNPEILSGRSRDRLRAGVVVPELTPSLSLVELR